MMPQISFKDTPIFYQETAGKENIVFLHGFLENHKMWLEFTEPLPKKYRKVYIDLPGFGASGNIGYVHSMEEMADAVKAVLDHLKIRRLTLVGHSMGGYVALAFAEKYPDMLKGLVLFYSTSLADSPEKKEDRNRAIQIVKTDAPSFIRNAIPNLFYKPSLEKFRHEIEWLKSEALQLSVQGIVAALEGMKIRIDREVLLHFGPCPVLFIAGANDPVLNFETLIPQMEAPKVTAKLVTSHGHMGFIEDKDLALEAIKNFLKNNQ
jgi:pimeloyl-ACP methyl ester carboxylesterase